VSSLAYTDGQFKSAAKSGLGVTVCQQLCCVFLKIVALSIIVEKICFLQNEFVEIFAICSLKPGLIPDTRFNSVSLKKFMKQFSGSLKMENCVLLITIIFMHRSKQCFHTSSCNI